MSPLIKISAVYGMSRQTNPDGLLGFLLSTHEKEVTLSIPFAINSTFGLSYSSAGFEKSVTVGFYYALNNKYFVAGLKFTVSPLNFAAALIYLEMLNYHSTADVLDFAFNNNSESVPNVLIIAIISLILTAIFKVPIMV